MSEVLREQGVGVVLLFGGGAVTCDQGLNTLQTVHTNLLAEAGWRGRGVNTGGGGVKGESAG